MIFRYSRIRSNNFLNKNITEIKYVMEFLNYLRILFFFYTFNIKTLTI